jgi:endonuclease YncB( thermonuclease family)
MPDPTDFPGYTQLADQLIERASKEQLADVARLLALNIGWYQQRCGDLPQETLLKMVKAETLDEETLSLLSVGMQNLVSALLEVTGLTEELQDEPRHQPAAGALAPDPGVQALCPCDGPFGPGQAGGLRWTHCLWTDLGLPRSRGGALMGFAMQATSSKRRPSAARFSRLPLVLLLVLPLVSWSQELTGHVVPIIDGDTLVVLDANNTQHKVKLAGIDCPERKQAWSAKAKQALSDYVFDRQVTVDWGKRDRYKRIVGKVLDGQRDVNLALVTEGMCWWYREYADEQSPEDRVLYAQAEEKARKGRSGLWSDPEPVPPWVSSEGAEKKRALRVRISVSCQEINVLCTSPLDA